MRPRWLIIPALLIAVVAVLQFEAGSVQAHGKEAQVELRCTAPDPASPLAQRCEATVAFTGDGEPISDARLVLSAVRPGRGGQIGGVPLRPLDRPGYYAAELLLPAYGVWQLTAVMQTPADGWVQIQQEVLPPSSAPSQVGSARARVVIGFNRRDVMNIGALALHLISTVALFGATAAVLVAALVVEGQWGSGFRRRVARLYPWIAGGSLALLGLSGAYNAMYNAPVRSPGLLHPATVAGLPFGKAYLIAFGVKLLLSAVVMAITALLAVHPHLLRSWLRAPAVGTTRSATPTTSAGSSSFGVLKRDACARMAVSNLLVGGVLLLTAMTTNYLHLLSHAGLFTGGQ